MSLETAARLAPSEAGQAGLSNLFAGAFASLVTQSVIVPIDVVSQRLMVAGEPIQSIGVISISLLQSKVQPSCKGRAKQAGS